MRLRGMSNQTLQHFKRNGLAKRAYTEQEAREQAARQSKNAYRCRLCRAWHVGGVREGQQ